MKGKINEVGRFKQRVKNSMYSPGYNCFDLNLSTTSSYRFNYIITNENILGFSDYVNFLAIPELGVKSHKIRITRYSNGTCRVYLTINGEKKDVYNIHTILNRLCFELKEN